MRYLLALFILWSAPAFAAATLNDEVQAWLAAAGIVSPPYAFYTLSDTGSGPKIERWDTIRLGAQPTLTQLAALAAVASAKPSYQAAIGSGLAVTSTGASSLNATYALDQNTTINIGFETTSILLNGTFTNGAGSRVWPDAAGAYHLFTVAQFKTFATAIGAYVDQLQTTLATLQAGGSASWPAAAATIP